MRMRRVSSKRPSIRTAYHLYSPTRRSFSQGLLPGVFLCLLFLSLCAPHSRAGTLVTESASSGAPSSIVPAGDWITNLEARSALADLEAALGRAEESRDQYERALEEADRREELLLRFADRMNTWGDFYRAEEIYRGYLRQNPIATEVWMKLASLLRSCERYEEAEGIYLRLLFESPQNHPALLGLARVRYLENRLDSAAHYIEQYLEARPGDHEGTLLAAEISVRRGNYDDAIDLYSGVGEDSALQVEALLGMGRVRLEQGKQEQAKAFFEQALALDPKNAGALFYCAGPETREKERSLSARDLEVWARLYTSEGDNKSAVRLYEASLEQDPLYFPSRIGLAETLAVDQQFKRAVREFEALAGVFPGNRKVLMGRARTLAWAKRYQESLKLYDQIHALSPLDPVPQKEKARTAAWAKDMDLALETYDRLLFPPVDQGLASAIACIAADSGDEALGRRAFRLADHAEKGSLHEGYEAFSEDFDAMKDDLSPQTRNRVQGELIRLLPAYNIQKGVSLEKKAKHLAWDLRFSRSLEAYEELTGFAPGNQEALFDYAQVQCALGLCDHEAETYNKLLELDSRHSLARTALERLEIRKSPSIAPGYSYWNERGRDRLSSIERHRIDLALDIPVHCRFGLRVAGHHWTERPGYTNESIQADGFTLAMNAVFNAYLKGEASWTRKSYRDERFDTRDTGHASLWANLRDYAQVGIGYDRTDELYNSFGIEQGIQADSWWLSVASHITRRLDVRATARYHSYSDDNSGRQYLIEAGYALTDHPRLFKAAVFAEHRDTREENIYRYQGGRLVDITHPYWTPNNYYAGGIRFQWHHDLSRLFICGGEQHGYNLNLTLGTDTEHNPSVELTGKWHWDFYDRWTIEVNGLIHRSRSWDAEGLWANIRYRF